jgi:hypothetical protein
MCRPEERLPRGVAFLFFLNSIPVSIGYLNQPAFNLLACSAGLVFLVRVFIPFASLFIPDKSIPYIKLMRPET